MRNTYYPPDLSHLEGLAVLPVQYLVFNQLTISNVSMQVRNHYARLSIG
jgi:hypothetical protein